MQPLVSIIIPTYNRAHLIGETLDSVLAQTYKNWECIVVDDGSTDYTNELLEFYCAKDARYQYHHRPKNRTKGANACRNYGFELSKGEYVQWLDSDDLLSEDKIEAQMKLLLTQDEIDVSFCKWVSFKDEISKFSQECKPEFFYSLKTPKQFFNYIVLHGGFFAPHVYLVKRQQIIKAGGWNEYLKINQDGEFFSRVLLVSSVIAFSEKGMAYYRRDASNDNTSIYSTPDKVEDVILSWKLIEQAHKIRYKIDIVPYVETKKKLVFYFILKTGFVDIAKKHPNFFKNELQRWDLEDKKRKSFSRKLNRIKRFIEVKVIGNLSNAIKNK